LLGASLLCCYCPSHCQYGCWPPYRYRFLLKVIFRVLLIFSSVIVVPPRHCCFVHPSYRWYMQQAKSIPNRQNTTAVVAYFHTFLSTFVSYYTLSHDCRKEHLSFFNV